MSDISYPEALDHMLAAWNEADSEQVRAHLERSLTADVVFIDPSVSLEGIDAFEQNVYHVQQRLPGAVYSRISAVDGHNNLYRYHWAIHLAGSLALEGFDVTEVRDGRVCKVLGFFGSLSSEASL